jgi:hypothetical protein
VCFARLRRTEGLRHLRLRADDACCKRPSGFIPQLCPSPLCLRCGRVVSEWFSLGQEVLWALHVPPPIGLFQLPDIDLPDTDPV